MATPHRNGISAIASPRQLPRAYTAWFDSAGDFVGGRTGDLVIGEFVRPSHQRDPPFGHDLPTQPEQAHLDVGWALALCSSRANW